MIPHGGSRAIKLTEPWVDIRLDSFLDKLHELTERSAREVAVSVERAGLANELQEIAGGLFHGIALRVGELLLMGMEDEVHARLCRIRSDAARGLTEVRRMSYELSFLDLESGGFVRSVKALARRFESETGISTFVRVESEVEVSRRVQSALHRVVYEAFANVERHARASGVVISIAAGEDQLRMTIRDDGVGLDQRQGPDWKSATHFGVRSMRKSVESVGGTFALRSPEPRGVEIVVTAPVEVSPKASSAL